MKRVECGAYMAEEGVWMNLAEAESVKMELKARGTKRSVFLANAITFTDGPPPAVGSPSSQSDDTPKVLAISAMV